MILIISEIYDKSTSDVIDWLISSDIQFFRVNKNDLVVNSVYNTSDIKFILQERFMIKSKKIKSYWYRRGEIGLKYKYEVRTKEEEFNDLIFWHLENELEELIRFFTKRLEDDKEVKSIGNYLVKNKKLDQLFFANRANLKIPKSLITTQKSELVSFYKSCKERIITKGIDRSPSLSFKNTSYEGYTEELNDDLIAKLPDNFFPSFFQENIVKQYELRIFYLKGRFYAMAIFSQGEEQTKTDMRKYNDVRPNKTVPYKVPNDIENKLVDFMDKMNLDSGSIDMIVDTNDEFYFLEVNPNGQFGMVSTPCNYYIEKKIAQVLI